VLVKLLAYQSIFYLIVTLLFGQEVQNRVYFVLFHSLRLLFIVFAGLIAIFRRSDSYYFPILKEMSVSTYWQVVFFLALSIRLPFLRIFQFGGILDTLISLFFVIASSFVIFNLAVLYHQRYWAKDYEEQRQLRINQLRMEGRLSKKELLLTEPILADLGEQQMSRKPISWLIVQIVASFLFALFISLLSSELSDNLITLFR